MTAVLQKTSQEGTTWLSWCNACWHARSLEFNHRQSGRTHLEPLPRQKQEARELLATQPVRGYPGLHKKGLQVSQRNFFVHFYLCLIHQSQKNPSTQDTKVVVTTAFKSLLKTGRGDTLATLMLEKEARSSLQIPSGVSTIFLYSFLFLSKDSDHMLPLPQEMVLTIAAHAHFVRGKSFCKVVTE